MSSFEILIKVIEDIFKLQLDMIKLANLKKEVLISGDIDELSKIIKQEASWVKTLSKLEAERIAAIKQLLMERKLSDDNITITDLIKVLESQAEKDQLHELNLKLTNTLEEIQSLNDLNTQLIKQSLDYIENMINTITGENRQQSYTYGRPTMKQPDVTGMPSSKSIFDKKA